MTSQARELTVEMLGALNYLHKNGVVHRDLKLENYIFTGPGKGEGQLKLIDFGLSRACIEGETMTTNVGSVIFKAPEVMAGAGYGTESDMWSLGVICHMLCTGLVPWEGDTRAEIEASITKEAGNIDSLMGLLMWFYESCKLPMDCQDFLLCLIDPDREARYVLDSETSPPFPPPPPPHFTPLPPSILLWFSEPFLFWLC